MNVTKSFDESVILDHLNLYIRENEFSDTARSKSAAARPHCFGFWVVSRLRIPEISFFDGKNINKLPPNRRQLNTVFQKYALFTHMTIAENIAFGLKIKKSPNIILMTRSNMH
mgnify:CR=1 FL=1